MSLRVLNKNQTNRVTTDQSLLTTDALALTKFVSRGIVKIQSKIQKPPHRCNGPSADSLPNINSGWLILREKVIAHKHHDGWRVGFVLWGTSMESRV
jgi:hypothetical protein